jgi:4-oxalocrotonate tautomerase
MPYLHVRLMEGRSDDQLRAMVERLTEAMVDTVSAKREAVQVIVEEVDAAHWATAGVLLRDA